MPGGMPAGGRVHYHFGWWYNVSSDRSELEQGSSGRFEAVWVFKGPEDCWNKDSKPN